MEDLTFGTGGRTAHTLIAGRAGHANAAALQTDGKIVVAGYTYAAASAQMDFALTRYDANGNLDPAFGTGGVVSTDFPAAWHDVANAMGIQADGKIVVAGSSWRAGYTDFAVARYDSAGALDATFGTAGRAQVRMITTGGWDDNNVITGLVIQPDGKIVTTGYAQNVNFQLDFALARWNANGTLDSTFGVGGKVITNVNPDAWSDVATSVALQPDGKLVVGGYSKNAVNQDNDFALVRYTTGGALDTTFGTGGMVTTDVSPGHEDILTRLALQSDGKIIAVGYTWSSMTVVRYQTNGVLDASFGTGGVVKTDVAAGYPNSYAHGVAIQADGKVVAAGYVGFNLDYRFALTRYETNGALDTGFGAQGKVTTYVEGTSCIANGVLLQPGGKIVAFGYSGDSSSAQRFALVRYLP